MPSFIHSYLQYLWAHVTNTKPSYGYPKRLFLGMGAYTSAICNFLVDRWNQIPFANNRLWLCSTLKASPLEWTSSLKITHQRRRPKSAYPTSHQYNGRLRLWRRWICHPIWPFGLMTRLDEALAEFERMNSWNGWLFAKKRSCQRWRHRPMKSIAWDSNNVP